jgi:DnaJ-class molecular chaperone
MSDNDDQSWRKGCSTCDGSGELTRYLNGGMEMKIPCPECGPDNF